MGGFFDIDSPLSKALTLVADLLLLSLFWLLFSLPVITIGASTTALFYVTTKRISNKEGYLFKDFFTSFKREFKKSTVIWIIALLIFFIVYFNISQINTIISLLSFNQIMTNIFLVLQYAIILELSFFLIFAFPILARFELNFKTLVQNAFFMANKHFPTSFACLILFALIVFLIVFVMPVFFIISIGLYAYLSSFLIVRVLKKYRPELDSDDNQD